jgi:hypothetical protein
LCDCDSWTRFGERAREIRKRKEKIKGKGKRMGTVGHRRTVVDGQLTVGSILVPGGDLVRMHLSH